MTTSDVPVNGGDTETSKYHEIAKELQKEI